MTVCSFGHHISKRTSQSQKNTEEGTKMIMGLEHLFYEKTLNNLGFFNLEKRQLRMHMVEVYKIVYMLGRVDRENCPSLS